MKLLKPLLLCVLFSASFALDAQTRRNPGEIESIRTFVQSFYDGYAPKAVVDHLGPAWRLPVQAKNSPLSPELVKALREDLAAQAKVKGEIVGLDFDPFLASQDPVSHYRVGRIKRKGDRYWVEVRSVSSGKPAVAPDVVAEIGSQKGKWRFVNFHYDRGQDLVSILKNLKRERKKQ